MVNLIDLKNNISNNQLDNLYIFTGEEFKIKQVYYNKISELYGNLRKFETVEGIYKECSKSSLFALKNVFVCYNDMEYLKSSEKVFNKLIEVAKKGTSIIVLVYDDIPEKSVFKRVFDEYITQFNRVDDDIALKYVSQLGCNNKKLAEKIIFNTGNSYGHIVEEVNKYKHFNQEIDEDVYNTIFYDVKIPPVPAKFANMFVTNDIVNIRHHIETLKNQNILVYISEIINTINICLFFKVYNKWDGGKRAYESGEYWGRIKELRDMYIPYSKTDLLNIRYELYRLDIDIRKGRLKAEWSWDYLIGVVL